MRAAAFESRAISTGGENVLHATKGLVARQSPATWCKLLRREGLTPSLIFNCFQSLKFGKRPASSLTS